MDLRTGKKSYRLHVFVISPQSVIGGILDHLYCEGIAGAEEVDETDVGEEVQVETGHQCLERRIEWNIHKQILNGSFIA